ncbi:MAG: S8 family serine peptidase [Propionibacteriales bacterium]|nr:S8 family serine peptidase [Propionibacteriales bacterium]
MTDERRDTAMRPHRWTATIVAAGLLIFGLPAPLAHADSDQTTIVVTVEAAEPDPAQAATDAITEAGGDVSKVVPITDTTVAVTVSADATEAKAIGAAADDADGVVAAEPSRTVHPTSTNDTWYPYLWDINNGTESTYGVQAEDAWPTSTGSGVVVGVIDTGITAHPDLTGSSSSIVGGNVVAGYDFISSSSSAGDGDGWDGDPTDEGDYTDTESSSWHGTHVSGTIAAIKGNSTGIAGVAPSAKVQPIRVLGSAGGSDYDVAAAITWGAGLSVIGVPDNPTPAKVLNLSLGGGGSCPTDVQTAIDAAVDAGTVVVVAAGNETSAISSFFPANCNHVVRVVATGHDGTRAWYSNYGTSSVPATVSAPGGSATTGSDSDYRHWIWSTWNDGSTTAGSPTYTGMIGTSMAAPHVAGVAALVAAAEPGLSVSAITDILTSTAIAPVSCTADACGAGIVNAAAAVAAASGSTPTPTPTPTPATLALADVTFSRAPVVGATIAAQTTASPSEAALAYSWTVSGAVMSTAASYTPSAADAGKTLSLTVIATLDSQTVTKSVSAVIASGSLTKVSSPKATGTFKVGRKVKATKGSWSPVPTSYKYQWYRSGKKISHATKSTYKLTRSDRHKKISVKVTVSLAGYVSASATSSSHKVK